MRAYYISKYPNESGLHEVHAVGCSKMSGTQNYTYLGKYSNSSYALKAAKKRVGNAVECTQCLSH